MWLVQADSNIHLFENVSTLLDAKTHFRTTNAESSSGLE